MILVIDNYDSFVHNLARYLRRLGQETLVMRHDAVEPDDIDRLQPAAVVISPGPCGPRQAGCSLDVVRRYWRHIPLLGVCLGHQTIAAAFGGDIVRAPEPMHGRTSRVRHDQRGIFAGIPDPFSVGRYHSLVADPASLPAELEVTARTEEGVIMALQHRLAPVVGVQFHPESVLTECGYLLLANFLALAGLPRPAVMPGIGEEWVEPPAAASQYPDRPVTF